tara:strand:+ start:3366 stop:4025 length:660 start_codon:yes stop_codon:yes gene_type:complete
MEYDDWIQSGKSTRVWLSDSMTALCQFAYVTPIPRVMHYNKQTRGRYECKQEKYEKCEACNKGIDQISEYTYGIYIKDGDKDIRHLSAAYTSHHNLQRDFQNLFAENINPCSILWEIRRGKIKTLTGREVNGYAFNPMKDIEAYVDEVDRPSPFDDNRKWVVERIVAEGIRDLDGKPYNLIDLFLELKSRFPAIKESKLKSYAIRLSMDGTVDLRRAKE